MSCGSRAFIARGCASSSKAIRRTGNVLRTAADAVGGVARLARVLRAPQEEVERWIDATEEAPLEAFLASLDLVAAGPFVRETRGVRVAAIAPAAQALPAERLLPSPQSAFDRAILPTLLGAALIA